MKSIRKCLGKEINSIRLLYVLLFGIVLFWVLRFICYKQDYILSLYSFVYYFVDYSNGFITRGLNSRVVCWRDHIIESILDSASQIRVSYFSIIF